MILFRAHVLTTLCRWLGAITSGIRAVTSLGKLYHGANRETIDAMKLPARDHGNDRAEGEER